MGILYNQSSLKEGAYTILDKEKISEYVERVFELYGLNKYDFFYTYDDETDEDVAIPLFDEDKESASLTLTRISLFTGLTEREITTMDKRAALKYWKEFPFFSLYNEFLSKWIWNAKFKSEKPTPGELLFSAIFDQELDIEERYNYNGIKKRLISKLQELSVFDSSYFVPNARLHIINLRTAEFFSFQKCGEMIRSYIDLVKRAQSLFFKAVRKDLTIAEIQEYNFLVSYLSIHDICMPSKYLYYHNVVEWREIIIEEGYTEFWSYAKIDAPLTIEAPWRCAEFFDNMELVQEFVNMFPSAKKGMREFAILVKNYSIMFRWEEIKTQEQLDDEFVAAYLEGRDYDPNDILPPPNQVYLEKEPAEVEEYSDSLETLLKAASPPAKGGLKLPVREYSKDNNYIDRLQRRISGR